MSISFRKAFGAGILAIFSLQGGINAGWPEFRHSQRVDQARNNYWPQPFRSLDATATIAPFEAMRCNGWRLFCTLNSCLFDEKGELTDAGKTQLYRILSQSPTDRRMIYVAAAQDSRMTDARLESAQVFISELIPSGQLPSVQVTHVEQPISSGQYQTAVHRALMQSVPTPRLPSFTGTAAGGGGGGGGGSVGP